MSKVNFGKLLKKIEAKESGKVSIVDRVDEACSNGITEKGAFSMLGLRKGFSEMQQLLVEGDRDKIFVKFFEIFSLMYAPDKRAKGVFHPSSLLTDCERMLFYSLSKEPPSDHVNRKHSGATIRTFNVGTWYHTYLQFILFSIGLLKQSEVPVVNLEKYIVGKTDGLFFPEVFEAETVLEVKTMNSFSYNRAVFVPFENHEFQASIYARELNATKVLYLYVNKDTSEMKEFLRPLNLGLLEKADVKIDSVITSVKKGDAPKRSCRVCTSETALKCAFKTKCWKDAK